jgi:PAS domain S-box-containing protein
MKITGPRLVRLSRLMTTTLLSTCLAMTAFEVVKTFALPRLTMWQSQGFTIVFTTSLATVMAYFGFRKLTALARQWQIQGLGSEQIVSQAGEGILTINKRGQVLALNPAAEQLFGYRSAEVLNQPVTQLLTEPPSHERQKLLHDTLPSGSILGLAAGAREVIGKRKNGDTFPLELTGSSMSLGDEEVSVAFLRDVSKRKRAQRYLLAHYATTCILAEADSLDGALPRILQAICEALHWETGAYWPVDADAGVASCGNVYQSGGGWKGEGDGIKPSPLHPPPSTQLTCKPEQGLPGRVWSTGKPAWVGDVLTTKDCPCLALARTCQLHGAFAFPILLGQKVCGIMTLFSCRKEKRDDQLLDIMAALGKQLGHFIARKQNEEMLHRSEQRFRQVAENINEVFWKTDAKDDRILYVSPSFEKVWVRSPLSLLQQPQSFLDFVHAEDRERFRALLDKQKRGENTSEEYRIVRPDGSVRWVWDRAFPIRNGVGEVYRIAGVTADVTEQKQLQDHLRQAQKMEAVGQLAGGVAHDFNNLLTVITGYSDVLLQSSPLGKPARGMLEQIHKAAERAAGLTRQLLAFSRKQILQPRVLDLNTLVPDVQKMLSRLIGEDIQLFTTLGSGLGRVLADPGQIEQILVNLAVNSRDAMPTGGKLIVETKNVTIDAAYALACPELCPGRYAMLAVSDTGRGMDQQTLGRIFEPFFTTKEQGKGTGLGLATVYGIVKQSGGHVSAYSEPGKGTTFKVYFPIIEETAGPPATGEKGRPAPGGKETVLLVEDEAGVRALAQQVLQNSGYTVLEASNGEEALRVAQKRQGTVNLLVTDVVMPHLGGRALAEAVTSRYPNVKTLYISGYTDDAVIRNGVLQAENEFLQKPFTMDALLYKVRAVLDKNMKTAAS